ncbi:MAG: hypothetical protein RLZZ584_2999 [Pseudomonadota bacterium]
MSHAAERHGRLGLLLAGLVALCATAQAQVGVSVEISQPGVYGRVDIGGLPQPRLIVPRPVVIAPVPRHVDRPEPVYLWVPPGHRQNWRRHCGEYRACGVPVYFVRDDWYHEHVDRGDRHGHGRRHGHDHRDDHRDHRRGDGGRDDDRGGDRGDHGRRDGR